MPDKKVKTKTQKSKVAKEPKISQPETKLVIKEVVVRQPKGVKAKTGKSAVNLTIPSVSLTGETTGQLSVPAEIFGTKINKQLLAQAVRVYTNNQTGHFSNTKTRGEVEGSTRKIFQQKGTGRARHGAIRAPIFVGGGIALGPKPRKNVLILPKKMRKAALYSALSSKLKDGEVMAVNDADQINGKTKQVVTFLKKIALKNVLFITDGRQLLIARASRNIKNVVTLPVNQINAFEVLKHQNLIFTEDAIKKLGEQIHA